MQNNSNIQAADVSMAVEIGALKMKNPMLTASGTFGFGEEFADFIDLERLGGFIVKGTTLEPREGNPYPRMAETPSGMLNAVGLQNKGVDHFISEIYPRLKGLDTNVLVNVSGAKIEDYVAVAEKLSGLERISAIEVNISCPNVKQGGMAFGTTCDGAAAVTAAVRKAWPRTLIVKLSPNVTSIADIARAVEAEGADSVSLINTLMGMAVDVERRRAPRGRQNGMADGQGRRDSGHRSGRDFLRPRRDRVHVGGGPRRPDRHSQFHQSGCHGRSCRVDAPVVCAPRRPRHQRNRWGNLTPLLLTSVTKTPCLYI